MENHPWELSPESHAEPALAQLEDQFELAVALCQKKRFSEAEAIYRAIVADCPRHSKSVANLAGILMDSGRIEEAILLLEGSLRFNSDRLEVHYNLGVALMALRRNRASAICFEKCADLFPDLTNTYDSLGMIYTRLQDLDRAERAYRRAIELSPDLVEPRFRLGTTLLRAGKYEEGWRWYEWRFELDRNKLQTVRRLNLFPYWMGEPLKGRSILIWREQGLGDEIMCVRYAEKLRAMGAARVSCVCNPSLKEIFHRVKGVSDVWTESEVSRIPVHDFCVSALDLPRLCGTTLGSIPSRIPYLDVTAKRSKVWKKTLPSGDMKVGLVWKGNPANPNDALRSLDSLVCLAPLWHVPGITFVSLQKGKGSEEAARPPAGQPILALGAGFRDFSDTATIIDLLDLVISVDTAVAHLAGALGKPVWVLLPFDSIDWRWMIGREDSPWYPNVMRLFRQGEMETWENVIERVVEALAEAQETRRRHRPNLPLNNTLAGDLRDAGG